MGDLLEITATYQIRGPARTSFYGFEFESASSITKVNSTVSES